MSSSLPPDPADDPPPPELVAPLAPIDPLAPVDPGAPVVPVDLLVRATPRLIFPTFAADTAPPPGMRVVPASETTGHPALYQCACQRTVPAAEMMDFRELPAGRLLALDLPACCCRACFHTFEATGRLLHTDVAAALGLDPATVAGLATASRFALAKGWHATTSRNQHLAPVRSSDGS